MGAVDRETGIAIRFIRQFDAEKERADSLRRAAALTWALSGPRIEPVSAIQPAESVRTEETMDLHHLNDRELIALHEESRRVLQNRGTSAKEAGPIQQQAQDGGGAYGNVAERGQSLAVSHHELTLENFEQVMTYQPWQGYQQEAGAVVNEALIAAGKAILRMVQKCPSRTLALQHIVDARMRANAAISHGRW